MAENITRIRVLNIRNEELCRKENTQTMKNFSKFWYTSTREFNLKNKYIKLNQIETKSLLSKAVCVGLPAFKEKEDHDEGHHEQYYRHYD